MKLFRPILALALGLAACGSANAVLINIDLVSLANGVPGEGGIEGQTFDFGGVPVKITSSHEAYLDSGSNTTTDAAGLGVCSTGLTSNNPANRCYISADDNVTRFEWVKLDFGDYFVSTSEWSFNRAQHGPTDPSETFLLGLDSNGGGNVFTQGTTAAFTNPLSISDGFRTITFGFNLNPGENGNQFYVAGATNVNAVPLPGSVALLGVGLFAMGMVSRTRSRKKLVL